MSYPGNPSLPPDVRERILETFRHTLEVAEKGNVEEARLGCDFVLRLDSDFEPADALAERLREASGPTEVADLRAAIDGEESAGGALPEAEEPVGDEEPPELVEDAGPTEPEAADELAAFDLEDEARAGTPGTGEEEGLAGRLRDLMEDRRFDDLAALAERERETIGADSELQAIMASAQERMEASHFAEGFLEQARSALADGDEGAARSYLEKARAMDADHPGIAEMTARVSGGPPAPDRPPIAAEPPVVPEAAEGPVSEAPEAEPSPAEMPSEELGDLEDLPAFDEQTDTSFADLADLGGFEPEGLEEGEEEAFEPAESAEEAAVPSGEAAIPEPEGEDLAIEEEPDLGELPDFELDEGEPGGAEAATSEEGPSDPDERIAELLDEGQEAADREEYQTAIDAWSRIFLIDIDHQEASRRIEEARKAKDEAERKIEQAFHEAVSLLEAGDTEEAKAALEGVLETQPNHVAAQEYLEKIEQGDIEQLTAPAPGEEALAAEVGAEATLDEEAAVAPEKPLPVEEKRTAPPMPKPSVEPKETKRTFWVVAGVVLVLVLVAGWFLWSRWETLFPNTDEVVAEAPAAPEQTPIDRATELFEEGKTSVAVAQLRRVPPASPYYTEAQSLISEWEELLGPTDEGPSEEELSERAELLTAGRAAAEAGRNLDALPLIEAAAEIAPLEGEDELLMADVERRLDRLEDHLELVRAGEYDRAIRDLWFLREEDPTDPDVNELLVSSYFNLGVRGLQQGRPETAREMLEEANDLAPKDAEIDRLLALAETYERRQQDLLYRIFVKYLARREV